MNNTLQIFPNRITISFWENGISISIKEKNITTIKEFITPCFISFKGVIFELHKDYIVHHKNDTPEFYTKDMFNQTLPLLLEYGELINEEEIKEEGMKFIIS